MVSALPFMGAGPKLRVWLAMFGASLAALLVPPLPIGAPAPASTIAAYMAMDFIAACIVLREPASAAQRVIGALFAGMLCYHIGFFITNDGSNVVAYTDTLSAIGWAQWACLLLWGAYDAGKAIVSRRGHSRLARDRGQVA